MRTKTRPLSQIEIRAFFEAFDLRKSSDHYFYYTFRLLYLLALRISDLMELKKGQIRNNHETIIEKKTKKKRQIYLTDEALQAVHNLEETTEGEYLLDRRNTSTYRRAVKRYLAKAKIDQARISTHSFRKTMATQVENIKGLSMAQKLLNHSTAMTTVTYLDDSDYGLESALRLIGSQT